MDPAKVWTKAGVFSGEWPIPDTSDQHIVQSFVHHYTLGAGDSLTVYTALASIRDGEVSSLESVLGNAGVWYAENFRCGTLCFATGDLNSDGFFDIFDWLLLTEVLFSVGFPSPLMYEADINGNCAIDSVEYNAMFECAFLPPGFCQWNTPTCCSVQVHIGLFCCIDSTGNIDNDPDNLTDIADLTMLIDNLFINFVTLDCPREADLNIDGRTDIEDLTFLIDHLFINFPPLPSCPYY